MIGGGVGGCSIAYHLAKLGLQDVVLVEQFELTYGSTWHSAGLVGQLRSSVSLTRMMMYSVELYAALRRETGKDPGWHELGGIRLASSPARLEEIQRQAGWAKTFGLPLEIISAAEAQERFPLISTDGVLGAAFLPRDGYLDPSQLTFALADGARHYGAEINTRTRVTAIERDARGRVCRVVTDKGEIETEVVVDAAGMAAPDVARLVGVTVPIIPMAHQYLITEPFDPPLAPLPTLRDPDNLVYWRTEVGGLVMGGYERDPAPFGLDGIPEGFEAQLLTWDYERFEELMEGSIRRVPAMADAAGQEVLQRPRGVHARRRVHPRPVRGAGLLGRRGVLRARARRARAASARSWPNGSSTASPSGISGTWTSAASAASTARRATRSRARSRSYSTYYDIKYPGEERLAGRPAAGLAGVRAAHGQRRELRREVRLGARQLVRSERRRRRRVAAPARLGGPALVAGDRGRVRRGRRARRADRPVVVREARRPRAGRLRIPQPPVRERGRPPARLGHLHAAAQRARRHRGRRHARAARERPLSCTSRAPRSARTTWPGCASTCPMGCTPTTSRPRARATASGARARATSCSR